MNTRDVFGRDLVPVLTAAQAAAHDRTAREAFGIPEQMLMENAGRALALITNALYPAGTIVGVAGAGHNGGDTIVALRTLRSWGRDVVLVRAAGSDYNRQLLHGSQLTEVGDAVLPVTLAASSVILDGILGTGAQGEPRPDVARMIAAITASNRPVIAVDLPSGSVNAVATVTFGYPKLSCMLQPLRNQCGRLISVEIGFPPLTDVPAQLITPLWAAARFPRRPASANKGTSGRLLLVAGSKGMAGAAVIAGNAAVRSGTGLVRIVSSADNREIIQRAVSEATFFERNGEIDYGGSNAVVAGPGMGANDATRQLLIEILGNTPGVPVLLDADALNVWAGQVVEIARMAHARPLLITPHPKEMSRLTKVAVNDITGDPVTHAQRLADETGATVLLKGQPSIVAHPGEPVLINSVGSSDFAVAGMGDQLAGVIGAMLAAGLAPRDAAGVGLFYGGRAGDIANLGRSLTPEDVTEHLARAFAQPGPATSSLGLPFITFDQPARW